MTDVPRGPAEGLVLSSPVYHIKGVGPSRAQALERLGLKTLEDVVFFFPRRYEDRRVIRPFLSLRHDERAAMKATVVSYERQRTSKRGLEMLRVCLTDGQALATAIWFNRRGLETLLKERTQVALYGKVSLRGRSIELLNPDLEILRSGEEHWLGRIMPVYPGTAALHERWLRKLVSHCLELGLHLLEETLPDEVLMRRNWPGLRQAVAEMHTPTDRALWLRSRHRLAFEEFYRLQLGLAMRRAQLDDQLPAPVLDADGGLCQSLLGLLPFELTGDQQKAVQQIRDDMKSSWPMNRLLQGDVGSGKTVVALLAMLQALQSGYQVAFMAPTVVLAQQHLATLRQWLDALAIPVGLLAGSQTAAQRQKVLEDLRSGELSIVVGTHALVQQGVEFKDLGLVVIDEQHRFGVMQRYDLASRHGTPHRLVMTATPIPRTLALTVYGDLSLSTIREMPHGRLPVKSALIGPNRREGLLTFLAEQMAQGHQVYWICPLIEESEFIDAAALEQRHAELAKRFAPFGVALLHGRMSDAEKDAVMAEFVSGKAKMLASTTVVEVGVDVGAATVMVVENPERFGLSQLHQLRGRVGRNDLQSWCFLLSDHCGGETRQRLKTFCRTTDGFEIAEMDMALRGPGEFCGVKQHGLTDFRVADLLKDGDLLELARQEAQHAVKNHQSIPRALYDAVMNRYGAVLDIAETG